MEPRFEQLGPMTLLGCPQYANPSALCPGEAWERLNMVKNKFNCKPGLEFAVEVYPPDFPDNDHCFYYMAGIPEKHVPDEMKGMLFIKKLQKAEYAVFPLENNDLGRIKDLFQYAYGEWLPRSDYEAVFGFDLEKYQFHPEKHFEIMIPVRKKG